LSNKRSSCDVERVVCARHCGGGDSSARAYEYHGVRTCGAAARLAGGPVTCPAGCLGFGDCERACAFDAITFDSRGLPVVDLDACTGCGVCVAECPRDGLLDLVPEEVGVTVRCASTDKAKAKRAYCGVSCIGCKKCEKECPYGAIAVTDFLAAVDAEACTACGICVSVCPQGCIDLFGVASVRPAAQMDGLADRVPGFEPEAPAGAAAEPSGAEEPR
jgi:heterodisulfide reductase subunit A-like polyferredoxin